MAFPKVEHLGAVMRLWKGYQTKELQVGWQEGFFDHRIRSNESAEEKRRYILMNPVRAGLVTKPEDWPYVLSASERAARPEGSPYR